MPCRRLNGGIDMAWGQTLLTTNGRVLHAKVMEKKLKLEVMEVWMGSGDIGDIDAATDLADKKLKAEILGMEQAGTDCKIRIRFSNESISEQFMMREIGFYAKDENGSLMLFSAMKDDTPATMPVKGTQATYRQTMTVAFGYSNAADVVVNPTIIEGMPEEKVRELLGLHDKNLTAHTNLFTSDTTSIEDEVISLSQDIQQLGARVKWVKDYMEKKGGLYLPKTGGTITGDLDVQGLLSAVTPAVGDRSNRVSTTEFVGQVVDALRSSNITDFNTAVANIVDNRAILKGQTRASYGDTGFRVFSDGFCIQWGIAQIKDGKGVTISLPLSMLKWGYSVGYSHYNGTDSKSVVPLSFGQQTLTGFYISNNVGANPAVFWWVFGPVA